MQSFTKKFAAKKKKKKTKRRSAKLVWRKHVSGFYQRTFIYSRFSQNCLVSSLSPWGIPMMYTAGKFFEIQNARKCISDTLSECTSIGWTWLTTVFFSPWISVRLPPFCHFTFLSAAAAIFVGILECYGEFRRNVNNKDTHNLPLCVFVTI